MAPELRDSISFWNKALLPSLMRLSCTPSKTCAARAGSLARARWRLTITRSGQWDGNRRCRGQSGATCATGWSEDASSGHLLDGTSRNSLNRKTSRLNKRQLKRTSIRGIRRRPTSIRRRLSSIRKRPSRRSNVTKASI